MENLFTRPGDGPGTLTLKFTGLSHPRAPDIVFTLKSSEGTKSGLLGPPGFGTVAADGDVPLGGGMHGGLSRAEMNCALVARGSGFEAGVSEVPVHLCDIAPTIEAALGLPLAEAIHGTALQQIDALQYDRVRTVAAAGEFTQAVETVRRGELNFLTWQHST